MKRNRRVLGGLAAAVGVTSLSALLTALGVGAFVPSGQVRAAVPATPTACASHRQAGATERAAEAVVERFLRTAVVGQDDGCAAQLAVDGLVPPRYATGLPLRVDGWYQLAPRIRNAKGLWEYAAFLWVDAPDAEAAAFEVLLELHGGRWLVSSCRVAPGSAEVDMSNAPT